jgi:hypothetical protein
VYDIDFDDGDVITDVPDLFVFPVEEYLLSLRSSSPRTATDGSPPWLGVTNVTASDDDYDNDYDDYSMIVGWYVVTIDGVRRSYSLLSDALRAYDADVVRKWRGGGVTKMTRSDLNLPEDWTGLLPFDDDIITRNKSKVSKIDESAVTVGGDLDGIRRFIECDMHRAQPPQDMEVSSSTNETSHGMGMDEGAQHAAKTPSLAVDGPAIVHAPRLPRFYIPEVLTTKRSKSNGSDFDVLAFRVWRGDATGTNTPSSNTTPIPPVIWNCSSKDEEGRMSVVPTRGGDGEGYAGVEPVKVCKVARRKTKPIIKESIIDHTYSVIPRWK